MFSVSGAQQSWTFKLGIYVGGNATAIQALRPAAPEGPQTGEVRV